jgi:hypothetical protein
MARDGVGIMKLILENWREYLTETAQINERGTGFMQRVGAMVGLTKDFNYDSAEAYPLGGETVDGIPFIVVQIPDPNDDGEIEGPERSHMLNPDAKWLVRLIDGTEKQITTAQIKPIGAAHSRGHAGQPDINREHGSKVLQKMEDHK